MDAVWRFCPVRAGHKNREAVQGEFFARETGVQALIREAIQNSLDARFSAEAPVLVEIALFDGQEALSAAYASRYFDACWDHFAAAGSGLRDAPTRREPCKYISIEDFGTKGLVGDVNQWHRRPGHENPFFNFFHAEGQSEKQGRSRGRWGVGKFVFPMSSRARSFLAYTIPSSTGVGLLAGQAILRSRSLAGIPYTPDCWYGGSGPGEHPLPASDPEMIEKFARDFRLRRSTEAGLSIVIPYAERALTLDKLRLAVAQEFYVPILAGDLVVEMRDAGSSTVFTQESFASWVASADEDSYRSLLPDVALAAWALKQKAEALLRLNAPAVGRSIRWTDEQFSVERLEHFRTAFRAGDRVGVCVPIAIRRKGADTVTTHCDVFLVRDRECQAKPTFVREGIIVSSARGVRTPGTRSLLLARDVGIATLLGDAEGPAHTEWLSTSQHFKDKYVYGASYLRFVQDAPGKIAAALGEDEDALDRGLLADLFFLPPREGPTERDRGPRNGKEARGAPVPPINLPVRELRPYRVAKVEGGFKVVAQESIRGFPRFVKVRAAYDRAGGSPLGKWSPDDFCVDAPPCVVGVSDEGASVVCAEGNVLELQFTSARGWISVTGFDWRRDLFVSARDEGLGDAAD